MDGSAWSGWQQLRRAGTLLVVRVYHRLNVPRSHCTPDEEPRLKIYRTRQYAFVQVRPGVWRSNKRMRNYYINMPAIQIDSSSQPKNQATPFPMPWESDHATKPPVTAIGKLIQTSSRISWHLVECGKVIPSAIVLTLKSPSLMYGSRGQYANKFYKAGIRILTAVGIKRDIVKTIQQGKCCLYCNCWSWTNRIHATPEAATFCRPWCECLFSRHSKGPWEVCLEPGQKLRWNMLILSWIICLLLIINSDTVPLRTMC